MKLFTLVLCILLSVGAVGCKSLINPVVVDQGPAVLQIATAFGVQAALTQTEVSKAEAISVRAYIADGKALIEVGQPPAYALDQLAALLNAKITHPLIRAAIQTGIQNLKSHVTLPTTGVLTPEAKVWVLALLNGAISGCDAYISGAVATSVITGSSVITFR